MSNEDRPLRTMVEVDAVYPKGETNKVLIPLWGIRTIQGCGLANKETYPTAKSLITLDDGSQEGGILLTPHSYESLARLFRVVQVPEEHIEIEMEPAEEDPNKYAVEDEDATQLDLRKVEAPFAVEDRTTDPGTGEETAWITDPRIAGENTGTREWVDYGEHGQAFLTKNRS